MCWCEPKRRRPLPLDKAELAAVVKAAWAIVKKRLAYDDCTLRDTNEIDQRELFREALDEVLST